MFVIGTAGHVDHGKSTLIRRLTGIDPDRLAEEKARGLTIDLGFAWTTLPSGREIGIVDVPGHERFVHNMLAGAGQVDAVLFVVDANEGWRRQSEEHLAILDLLGARGGVVALTKIDTAPDPDAAAAQVRQRIAGTVLDGAAVVPVSAVSGDGIDDLLAALDAHLDRLPVPRDDGRPRLFVDRSFSIKGAGTVVTGTLTGGVLRDGDDVEIAPAGVRARIRSIQTHRAARDEAVPTSRVALNLAGLDRHHVARGDAVVTPGRWRGTTTIDVRLRAVRSLEHPVTPRGAYLLYAGTAETPARLRLLDASEVTAGGEAFARLTLTEPVIVAAGDRIVLRDTGRRETVAGGLVLDAHPVAGRVPADRVERLQRRAADPDPVSLADRTIEERGVVAATDLAWLCAAEPAGAIRLPSFAVSRVWFEAAAGRITDTLTAFHGTHPLERGVPRDTLRAGFDDARLFDETLDAIPDVVAESTIVRLTAHRVTLDPEQDRARKEILAELDGAGFSPPPISDVAARHGGALVKALVEADQIVVVAPEIGYTAGRIGDAKRLIAAAVAAEGGVTASRVREVLGTTRKYAIPLLEWLDRSGFTRRDGDVRTVRE